MFESQPPPTAHTSSQHVHEAEKEQQAVADLADEQDSPRKKPMSFYFAFLSLVIMVLIVSVDSTALAVAIPVSQPSKTPPYNDDCAADASASAQNRFSPVNWAERP